MGLFRRKKSAAEDVEKDCKKRGGLITGIIVGGAIGSVASLLFAPKKGSETRAEVAEKGKELFGEGKSKAEEFLEKYRR